jgi:hypothetical protein
MGVTTRALGYNFVVGYFSTAPTCTACSADADAIRFTAGACTVIGGFDTISGLGGTKEMIDVGAFEDTMDKVVPGRIKYSEITFSGNLDPGDTSQKTLSGDIFHEGVVAASNPVRVYYVKESVNKRKWTWKAYTTKADIGATVKGKATFTLGNIPISKIQACTYS